MAVFHEPKWFVNCLLQGTCHSAVVSSRPSQVTSVHEILWTRSPFLHWIQSSASYLGGSDDIEVATKWPLFCKQHFRMNFLFGWKLIYFDLNFNEIRSWGSSWQQISTGSNNGLAPNKRHALIWTNGDYWRICKFALDPVKYLVFGRESTYWGRNKMAVISRCISNAFLWM